MLNENCIPLSIVSAGIGDIIEEMFIQNRSLDFKANKNENIKIIANFMNFEGDKMFNLEHKMIHMYNKSDAILYDKDHLEVINERSNVIILGDSEGKLFFLKLRRFSSLKVIFKHFKAIMIWLIT